MANVVMIGATSTVAQAMALQFAARGDRLFCLARNEQKLTKFATSLSQAYVGGFCFDFNESDRVEEALSVLYEAMPVIDIVIFAHGELPDQQISEHDYDVVRKTFEGNLLSVLALLIPLANRLEQQGRGKLGVITSVAGDRGRPRNYTYGAAKGALSLYLQGLRSRLWGSGVEVYDFKMGPVNTPMTVNHEKNFSFSTPEKVATIMVNALQKKRYTVYVPGYWIWVMRVVRLLPEALFQRLKFLSAR
ncbi:Oxidoreductase, short-chain dehydrogenase/reductase family [hydrothermal vent metagenome]|uniref:Oxidoreductase, short-chain dehydrogenase/reductase family n=1 Tax=hydrothermal vent metagenome TaxID=652676 RepID=A0A3B0ZK40_9ZZZZ